MEIKNDCSVYGEGSPSEPIESTSVPKNVVKSSVADIPVTKLDQEILELAIDQLESLSKGVFSPVMQAKLIFHQMSPETNIVEEGLSGMMRSPVFKDISNKLESYAKNLQSEEDKQIILKLKETIDHCFEDAFQLEKIYVKNQGKGLNLESQIELEKMANGWEEKIQEMKENEALLIPGGTTGHAVLYEVYKNPGGTYEFSIINTGLGIQVHHNTKKDRIGIRTYEGLESSDLNAEFLIPLLHIATINPPSIENDQHSEGVKSIYRHLANKLKLENEKTGRWHKEQRGGICTFKPLSVWLHGRIARGLTPEERNPKDELLYEGLKLHILKQNQGLLEENPEIKATIRENMKIKLEDPFIKKIFLWYKHFASRISLFKSDKIESKRENKSKAFSRLKVIVGSLFSRLLGKELVDDEKVTFMQRHVTKKIRKVERKMTRLSNVVNH